MYLHEKKEKNKGGKVEETSQVVALNGHSRITVVCYVVARKHDGNCDSLVDCCGLVGGVNVKAKSIGWLLEGGLGELKEVGRTNYPSGEI